METHSPEDERGSPGRPPLSNSFSNNTTEKNKPKTQTAQARLRPYQVETVGRVEAEFVAGHRRVLLVAATGAGKTVMAVEIVCNATNRGKRVLFLAHRRELIAQASRKLYEFGIDHGIIQAGYPTRPDATVQVASVSTLYARAVRSSALEMPPADLLVIDEAHHIRARTYSQILARYPDADVLGLTATPCRGDGRGLGNAFQALVESAPIAELIADGYLVRARIFAPTQPDLTGVKVERGDFVEKQLAERMDKPQLVGDVIEHWHRLAESRRTVVFAAGVGHSLHLRDEFRRSGVMAEHIDGDTPPQERDAILAGFAAGNVDVVCNAMVLTEGWDCPEASALVLARPTKSLGLYRQMVGRVLRSSPGKTDALILDHAGAVFAHGFPDDMIGWTLSEDRRAANIAHIARRIGSSTGLETCPECSAVRSAGRPCPACGWRPKQKAQVVDIADGSLGQYGRDHTVRTNQPSAADMLQFHRELTYIAQERDYAGGWVAHKYREKFGAWPAHRSVQPIEPSPATRSWVRSRQIAFARSRSA
jgi:DNA repair protein RadD